ncbi:alpha/beta hydrolase [uncultured Cohaesibacter sp.]|uniref:alpha/beta hydrolase n=1 Tax=uncultured Cohaesibacter sp. TaxID=1002546 RepID=UPI0029312F45|nr:alpha/beta hydrolase [uncultured Cohaesibacter sp.]
MPILADYYYQTNGHKSDGHPIIYLHGSGRSETDGADFLARLGLRCSACLVRGPYSQRPGYGFVQRNEDHTLDHGQIRKDAAEFSHFLVEFAKHASHTSKAPILIGYSSGAIMAAATLWNKPSLIAGAVLLRPQSPSLESPSPLVGLPILLLSGLWDERREPQDASDLEIQLQQAGARVTHLTVKAGHAEAEDNSDSTYTRHWLEDCLFRL